jgi:glucose/arabinose dehydrogenase
MQSRTCILTMSLIALLSSQALGSGRGRAVKHPDGSTFCEFGEDFPGVTVPPGFCIRKFADIPCPRVLVFAGNGDLFVASPKRITPGGAPPGPGAIFLLRETESSRPPQRFTFAEGDAFETVHGLAISGDSFFYTVADSVYMVPFKTGDTVRAAAAPTAIATMFTLETGARFAHSLAVDTAGAVYVSRGQVDNNTCPSPDPRIGSVLRIGSGHSFTGDIVADGLRDPLFIRCMPWGACYAAELSGDLWEALGGTEKLLELHDGDHYGYPCCIDRDRPNPEITPRPDCSRVVEAKLSFPLHHTPFGFDWERSGSWPQPYAGGFFVGLHGKFGTWENTGLQWAPTDPATHIPTTATANFATGFGHEAAISRVADVVFAPDGRLFFSDDQGGAIYWIAPRLLRRPSR